MVEIIIPNVSCSMVHLSIGNDSILVSTIKMRLKNGWTVWIDYMHSQWAQQSLLNTIKAYLSNSVRIPISTYQTLISAYDSPQDNQPNTGIQGMESPLSDRPNMAFQGMATLQGDQPNMAFQGMIPPHGAQPNMAFQDKKTSSKDYAPKRKRTQPHSERNGKFQVMAGASSDHPNQGMLLSQGGPPMVVMFQEEHEKTPMDMVFCQRMAPMPELKKTIEELFYLTMNGGWDEVVNIYEDPSIQKAMITKSEGTILHIAVNNGKTDIVENLVEKLMDLRVLDITNKMGNTAIHLAAIAGNVRMCKCMAEKRPQLVVKPNTIGETPLLAAVKYGRKEAFIYLHSKCYQVDGNDYLIRKNGYQNILHAAIEREYFDLAYQIIKKYNKNLKSDWDLANFLNVKGFSALHLLASRPSAFRSGSQLGRFKLLFYNFIVIDRLEETPLNSILNNESQSIRNIQSQENYPTSPKWLCSWALWRSPPNQRDKEDPHDLRSGPTVPQWLWWWRRYPRKQRDEENPHDKRYESTDDRGSGSKNNQREGGSHNNEHSFPPIYSMCNYFFKPALVVLQFIGFINIDEMKEEKQKHTWAVQIMEELVSQSSWWEYDPASMGVVEMVEKILDVFPVAICDVDDQGGRNALHFAAANRKHRVFKVISERCSLDYVFRRSDHQVNTPLHLAAKLDSERQPWRTSSAVLQILLELNWFKIVSKIMPPDLLAYRNADLQTAKDIFTKTHKDMIKEGADELTRMANSCSVVAALIATVAFATAATIPGGFRSEDGKPMFEGKIAFYVFTVSSFLALCASIISVITFLAILNYPHQESDFGMYLPRKMMIGFTSLLLSIAFMFASFCASHFFLLKDKLHHSMAYPLYLIYLIVCFIITLFAICQFPLYFDIIKYSITRELPDN
ncbi:uncharacterized protein LOC131234979 isoform X5 [Magnolia sinica]|uniref:uncharacterized protein LOC131234979 isoform X5 n=1 Tax=Magnolia sinica TaxID=86752 RepID=UPI00265B0BC9|nr:uncharacterized protein LOC131234979 isoform X5 [Magnolia sinica]